MFFFVSRRRGRHKHGLRHQRFKFFEFEWAVVAGGRQAEAVIHQVLLARGIAFVHGAHLRHGHVRFVHEQECVFGEVIKQSRRRGTCGTAREVAGVVFNAFTKTHFVQHFQIKTCALLDALRFNQAHLIVVKLDTVGQLHFDGVAGFQHGVARGHVMAGRIHSITAHAALNAACKRVEGL